MSTMKLETVSTPDGRFCVAGGGRVFAAALVDLLVLAATLMWIFSAFEKLDVVLPQWLSPILGVLIFLYALLARRSVLFSFGNWGLALRRYSYGSIAEYSGSGALYIIENVHSLVVLRRATIIGGYLGITLFVLSRYAR